MAPTKASGPAVRRILQREYEVHGLAQYERLASVSASHIYNPRRSRTYREHRVDHTKTRLSAVNIGERRKPDPRGQPGFVRVDAVHQGDTDSRKGIYHINAAGTVTQWQFVGCCETISEALLLPVLEAMLHQFPLRIHSPNCASRPTEFEILAQTEDLKNVTRLGNMKQVAEKAVARCFSPGPM